MTASRTTCPPPRVMALALMLATMPATGLELGPAEPLSTVGQPLHLRAPIGGPGSERRLRTAVRCLEGDCERLELRSFIAGRGRDRPVLVVRSFTPVRNPTLRVELEVGNDTETVRRELTLRLRQTSGRGRGSPPPMADEASPPPPRADFPTRATPTATRMDPVPAAPGGAGSGDGQPVWVVQPGQTLSGIAVRLSRQHGGGASLWMDRLHSGNPAAFIRGDRHRLRAGASLTYALPGDRGALASTPAPAPRLPGPPDRPAPVPLAPTPAALPAGGATETARAPARPDGVRQDLTERLARLEARIRDLKHALALREGAISEANARLTAVQQDGRSLDDPDAPSEDAGQRLIAVRQDGRSLGPSQAAGTEGPGQTDALAPGIAARSAVTSPSPTTSVEVQADRSADGSPTVASTAVRASAANAGTDQKSLGSAAPTAAAPASTPVADSGQLSATPATPVAGPRIGWLLTLSAGVLFLVLALVVLLRRLARPTGRHRKSLRGDDFALQRQIRERLVAHGAAHRPEEIDQDPGIDPRLETFAITMPARRAPAGPAPATTAPATRTNPTSSLGEEEVVTEVDVKIVYGLFDEAESVLAEALKTTPGSARLLLKLGEVRFYRGDANALVTLAERVLLEGHQQPAWLWAKIERLGRELCPDRAPFNMGQARPGLRSVS